MKAEAKPLLTTTFPLMIALAILAGILILSFGFKIYQYPLFIREGGIVESLSAAGYFLCALYIIVKGKWTYIRSFPYILLLIILLGLRELDLDKQFTSMGIFKSRLYLTESVPLPEKLGGLITIGLLLYIAITLFKNHTRDFFHQLKNGSPVHIGVLLIIAVLVLAKTLDGIGRKLGELGIKIEENTIMLFEVAEEILELGIPMLIAASLVIYFARNDRADTALPQP